VKTPIQSERLREWLSLVAAIALGPAFLLVGGQVPGSYVIVCVLVVPLLTLAAGRLKFMAWQVAILSMTLTVIADNLRDNAIHGGEIPWTVYVFWAMGTLCSSPLPVHGMLRRLGPRKRYAAGVGIAAIALIDVVGH
jgi:hypothetical protein